MVVSHIADLVLQQCEGHLLLGVIRRRELDGLRMAIVAEELSACDADLPASVRSPVRNARRKHVKLTVG
jgi:hypothetical protein